jgi:hypothetical protein
VGVWDGVAWDKVGWDVNVWKGFCGGWAIAGVNAGVGGPEDIGEGGWTTHILRFC